jgi:hypothetical protein
MNLKTNKDYMYSEQHVLKRLQERYGLTMSGDDYWNLNDAAVRQIVEGNVLAREGTQRTVIVVHQGQRVVTVYDVNKALVTTVLPQEHFVEKLIPELKPSHKRSLDPGIQQVEIMLDSLGNNRADLDYVIWVFEQRKFKQ